MAEYTNSVTGQVIHVSPGQTVPVGAGTWNSPTSAIPRYGGDSVMPIGPSSSVYDSAASSYASPAYTVPSHTGLPVSGYSGGGKRGGWFVYLCLFAPFLLLIVGIMFPPLADLAVNGLPLRGSWYNGARHYKAFDVSVASIFRWSPLSMEGNVTIDGNLWHANIATMKKVNIVVNGDVSNSSIGLANGSLLIVNASHSKLGAEHLTTTGFISNTLERGDYIVNKGTLGPGNDIRAEPRFKPSSSTRRK